MAAEDAVVDGLFQVAMKLLVGGTELGLKIVGPGAKAVGLGFFALGKHIINKRREGKALTPGEIQFEKLMKSKEEIHSIWLHKDDLNSELLVSEGETVHKGDKIALSGSTGNSSGPHCHFEVRIAGNRVNPMDYLEN